MCVFIRFIDNNKQSLCRDSLSVHSHLNTPCSTDTSLSMQKHFTCPSMFVVLFTATSMLPEVYALNKIYYCASSGLTSSDS